MAGKYASLRGKLPAFEESQPFQERVNAAKQFVLAQGELRDTDGIVVENLNAANVSRLAALFAQRKAQKDAHEEQIAELNVELEALSQLLVEALEDQQIQKVELASGATCYLQDTPYPVVKDREALLAWIKKQKMASLLTIHYQTLKGIVNERLVGGKTVPPGVEVYLKTQARLRNGTSSSEDRERE